MLQKDGSRREQYFWGHFQVGDCVVFWVKGIQSQTGMDLNPGLANHWLYVPGLIT